MFVASIPSFSHEKCTLEDSFGYPFVEEVREVFRGCLGGFGEYFRGMLGQVFAAVGGTFWRNLEMSLDSFGERFCRLKNLAETY